MGEYYSYQVERIGDKVFYRIYKNGSILTTREVLWIDLGMLVCIFIAHNGTERAIKRQLKLAHKLANKAIDAMKKYEQYERF